MLHPLLLAASLAVVTGENNPVRPLFSWSRIDWNFPNVSMRKSYEASGDYAPTSNVPLGVAARGDKLFVTVPRWKRGVPANLNYINLSEAIAKNETSPRLTPYPSWEANDVHAEDGIVNILRMSIDGCDRMWAVDSGVDDIWGHLKIIRPPRLIAIDLKTNQIVHRYTFKESDLTEQSFFADTVVDVDPNNCDDAYVYNSDLGGYGLVVYSLAKNDSWRIRHNYFYLDPLAGDYNISGIEFQWSDGLFGLALGPRLANGSRTLYFHAMSSTSEFAVSTDLIKDETALAKRNSYREFRVVGHKGKNSQGTSMALDPETGVVYLTQLNKNALACWDTNEELNPDTFRIVARDNEKMIFPNDLALDLEARKLYLVSDDLATFQYSEFDWNRTNFYVHVASLEELAAACRGSNRQSAESISR